MRQDSVARRPDFLDRVLGCPKYRHLVVGITEFNAKGCQRFPDANSRFSEASRVPASSTSS